MPPEETVLEKSVLDKPLHQLTEDDISQLTREDCRRYLKKKGMRRPSWNKSQAIQQVISLKTLLDPRPRADSTPNCKRLYAPRFRDDNVVTGNNNSPRTAPRAKSPGPELSTDVPVPYERNDSENPTVSGYPSAAVSDSIPPRTRESDNKPVGQMTIFYCGKVNVYDDIPADKARAIMHLAASGLSLPRDVPFDDILAMQPACLLQDTNTKSTPDSVAFPTSQIALEGHGSRKACVQRFLEKKKDRHKRMNVKY